MIRTILWSGVLKATLGRASRELGEVADAIRIEPGRTNLEKWAIA